uniref:Uncharacterized protein n=1 Tax=Schistosoma haematobium TaxID=6185 RepID=A0A095AR71_SCHHA
MTTDLPEVTGSPIWLRKMRTLFRRLDSCGHGYLMIDDLLDIGTTIFNIYPKMLSYKYDELVKTLVYLWYQVLCTHVSRQLATTININENTFIDNLLKAFHNDFYQYFNEKFIIPLFVAMDQDDDNYITSTEFQTLMIAWKSIPKDCEFIFRYYSDKNNKLNKENFQKIFIDYFMSDNINSNIIKLWGPLINYKRAEDYGTIDCGPVWEGKIRTMYRRLDINETMKLKCHDLLQIGQFLIQRAHLDRRRADAVMRAMLNIWVKFLAIDKNGLQLIRLLLAYMHPVQTASILPEVTSFISKDGIQDSRFVLFGTRQLDVPVDVHSGARTQYRSFQMPMRYPLGY